MDRCVGQGQVLIFGEGVIGDTGGTSGTRSSVARCFAMLFENNRCDLEQSPTPLNNIRIKANSLVTLFLKTVLLKWGQSSRPNPSDLQHSGLNR